MPQRNQCIDCLERSIDGEPQLVPIGPKARHLNRPNGLDGTCY